MKTGEYVLLGAALLVGVVNLVVTIKIAMGLQQAANTVNSVTGSISNIAQSFGL